MKSREKKATNDFVKWHTSFRVMYLLTFVVGLLRSIHLFFVTIHPLIAVLSVIIPLTVYLMSKNKRLIMQMIIQNFNLKGNGIIKVAKISTVFMIIYYIFSILSGILLNNTLYTSVEMYNVLYGIHSAAKIMVPLVVVIHVVSRLLIKKARVN